MDDKKIHPICVGLTAEEAARRLAQEGPNEIVPSRIDSFFSEARKILLEPMGAMLLSLSALYALIGDKTDALFLFGAYFPVVGVDVLLEVRALKVLKAMRAHLVDVTKVIRDGLVQDVPTKNIVVGDVVVFEEGQTLPVDGKILQAEELKINEAALTGESVPVEKEVGFPFFGGTIPLQGRGIGVTESTGRNTRFGKIASLIKEVEEEQTPLQKKVGSIIRKGLWGALVLAAILWVVEIWRGQTWIHSLIVALTFGMAAVPEEFPIVFTLYLSLGAWRLSRHGVLVKSLPSVEALGSVDVICTDKTGTLTEGRFQLEGIELTVPIDASQAWKCALMACEVTVVDSMEAAIFEKGKDYVNLLRGWKLKWDYPFEKLGKHMSHVWENTEADTVIAMKGAIEGVLEHCELSSEEQSHLNHRTHQLAAQGKRLLGLAYREGKCTGVRSEDEHKLKFIGFLIFNDPVRESARSAVLECQRVGIAIKMLTGDHPVTAHAVADEIGMEHDHQLLFTGDQLSQMDSSDRQKAFLEGAIFSRVLPEQKYEMVQALKANGKVVAMTGDGINDAPALKLADIGISMGGSATDVARSSAQMILLKNDFKGIVEAVFEGRRIFSNLKRSFSYLIAFHVPLVVLAFVAPLLGWGDLLLPIHVVLLELVVHPVSAFGFENLPAREGSHNQSLLTRRRLFESLLAGGVLSIVCLVAYRVMSMEGLENARTFALATVLFGIMFFVFMEAWPEISRRLLAMASVLVLLTVAISRISFLGDIFHVSQLNGRLLGMALLLGLGSAVPTWLLRWRESGVPTGIRTRVFTVKG